MLKSMESKYRELIWSSFWRQLNCVTEEVALEEFTKGIVGIEKSESKKEDDKNDS